MTIYEKSRLKIQKEMNKVISELDEQRLTLGETEYWKQFQEINGRYAKQIEEVDAAERQRRSLMQAGETGNSQDRPEQRYVDVLGQLKSQKLTELISALIECSNTTKVTEIHPSDPFYHDKLDPIGTFERWWQEELQNLPSYTEMQKFLDKVHINEEGFIVYDMDEDEAEDVYTPVEDNSYLEVFSLPENKQQRAMLVSDYVDILKPSVLQSARKNSIEKKKERIEKAKSKVPLLASTGHVEKQFKRQRAVKKANAQLNLIEDIIRSYDLDPELEGLLIDHATLICVPSGMMRDDDYRPMLEQFLRYVQSPKERLHVVRTAISKNWRILSNGTI